MLFRFLISSLFFLCVLVSCTDILESNSIDSTNIGFSIDEMFLIPTLDYQTQNFYIHIINTENNSLSRIEWSIDNLEEW